MNDDQENNRFGEANSPTNDSQTRLDRDGFTVVSGVLDDEYVDLLTAGVEQVFAREGAAAGGEFKQEAGCRRLANLVDKHRLARRLVTHSRILPLVHYVLGGSVKLSSLNARSANPQNAVSQPLHCDMGALPDDDGPWVCNVVWLLDDFTANNGALRVVPGTHVCGRLPQDALEDPHAAHPAERLVTARRGDAIVMNAHLWHGGTANQTDAPRRAVHAFYCRRDKPQQQFQESLLSATTIESLTPEEAVLLALGDEQNRRLAAESAQRSGFLK